MDAGLAAVCGALAGALATIGAALTAGRAQREAARIAARAEHQRQRRQPREGAYREFIAATEALRKAIGQRDLGPYKVSTFTSAYVYECRTHAASVASLWLDIALAGPKAASAAAAEVARTANVISSLCAELEAIREDHEANPSRKPPPEADALLAGFELTVQPMEQSLSKFIGTARDALDDNGS
ncbi:hypothetical protein [Streptomyces odonnellii]|uniref:hypothetical protein n=1 Tax=Streptomyces odonnellii TaxID=1417980 RepID=UPI000B0F6DCE|nr:hypothetical protein [Streptomyces odonnellii]